MRRDGTIQSRAKEAQRGLISVHKYLVPGVKKGEPGSAQWDPMTGQETTGTNSSTGY